ncbi:MAG TPA: 50S ribosomal protein L16 [Methanomassiliicoccales archaeon]|nr:50S ribosomal protein L16 [Methanomassiliicoccales archaeon]
MARKPARMYTQIRGQAYTRKEYMGGVPAPRINQFDQGNPNGDFPIEFTLRVKEACQIRHTALEAARISANRLLTKNAGATNFYLKIRTYPHNVLRENKLATGAGADRVSSGMRAAFGKAVGTAARVTPGQPIITVRVPVSAATAAKEALWSASLKLPTPCFVKVEKGGELLA